MTAFVQAGAEAYHCRSRECSRGFGAVRLLGKCIVLRDLGLGAKGGYDKVAGRQLGYQPAAECKHAAGHGLTCKAVAKKMVEANV